MCSLISKPLCIYEDRYRGEYPQEGVFLVYPHNGSDLFRMEPYALAPTATGLWERVLAAHHPDVWSPLAGGTYDTNRFDFTLLRVEEDAIPDLLVRLFDTLSPEQATWFSKYLDATILVRSASSTFGSIRRVLDERRVVPSA